MAHGLSSEWFVIECQFRHLGCLDQRGACTQSRGLVPGQIHEIMHKYSGCGRGG